MFMDKIHEHQMDEALSQLQEIDDLSDTNQVDKLINILDNVQPKYRFSTLEYLLDVFRQDILEYIVANVELFTEGMSAQQEWQDEAWNNFESFYKRLIADAISKPDTGQGLLDAFFGNFYEEAADLPEHLERRYVDSLHKSVMANMRYFILEEPEGVPVNDAVRMLLEATRIRNLVRPVGYSPETVGSVANAALRRERKELLETFHSMGLLRKRDVRNLVEKAYRLGKPAMARFLLELEPSLKERYQVTGDVEAEYSEDNLLYLLRFQPTRADLLIRRMVREGRTNTLTPRVVQVALLRGRHSLFSFIVTNADYNERERKEIVRYIRQNGLSAPSSTVNKLSQSEKMWVSGMLAEALSQNA